MLHYNPSVHQNFSFCARFSRVQRVKVAVTAQQLTAVAELMDYPIYPSQRSLSGQSAGATASDAAATATRSATSASTRRL